MGTIITPRVGIGLVRLGMSRLDVRALIGQPEDSFVTAEPHTRVDDFQSFGIQVDYDELAHCKFITAVEEADPLLDGKSIIGISFVECLAWFENIDDEFSLSGTGIISRKLGIAIYAPSALKEPSLPVEAVSVFLDGYYDKK